MAAKPSRACANGSTRSITGRTPVCSQKLATRPSWSRVPMVEPVTDSWVKKILVSSAGDASPLVAPQITIRPPGRRDRTEWAQVARPMVSMTTSTRSGSRAPGAKAWSAPSLTARSRLASLRLVAQIR
jgi:hypothetical protein